MTKKERERRKLVVYEAYMAGQARGEKTSVIKANLSEKYHVSSRTIENWIYELQNKLRSKMQDKRQSFNETAHKQKLRVLANNLINEIRLPQVPYCFVADLKPGQIYNQISNNQHFLINIDEKSIISIPLSINTEGELHHLFQALTDHFETGGFSDVLSATRDWQKSVSHYLHACHNFLKLILSEKPPDEILIPNDHVDNNEEPGYKFWFYTTVAVYALEKASNRPTNLLYLVDHLQNGFWLLRYSTGSIYLAQTKEELDKHKEFHKDLLNKYAVMQEAKNIAKMRQDISTIENIIHKKLRIFTDMECVPGNCALCQ